MAAKAIDKSVAEAILIDWRVGQLSQQQIAQKHRVSKGLVNKLCKGVNQDGAAIVTAGVQYRQALSGHDDRMVTALTAAVDEATKRQHGKDATKNSVRGQEMQENAAQIVKISLQMTGISQCED